MKRALWQLRHVWRHLGLPGWAGASLLVLGALGWAMLSAPLASETQRLAVESAALQQRLGAKGRAEPPSVSQQDQLQAFTQRFVADKELTPSLAKLQALARRRGVALDQAEFRFVNEPNEPLSRYVIILPLKADYASLRSFSRDAMREMPGLAVEEVNVRRADAKSPLLEAQLRLVLFVTKAS